MTQPEHSCTLKSVLFSGKTAREALINLAFFDDLDLFVNPKIPNEHGIIELCYDQDYNEWHAILISTDKVDKEYPVLS